MADDMSVVRVVESNRYMLRILLDNITTGTLGEIVAAVPKLVAEQYLKDHMQEILGRVSPTEISSCIAAAVAAKIAESYKAPNA